MPTKIPNPSEMMRARHPDLFSDSTVELAPQLSRAVFEYHLDTLTNRKEETLFEHFSRKLAEKEICPNLRVQTGPTGGGDSKVDTETYPVAEEIAERCWIGSPSAGKERWAFAFSAKKDWRTKVQSDVASIVSTGRKYERIHFLTNQFVKDKTRAELETKLSADAGSPVHIYDRAWIVEKVYESGHLGLATAALGIETTTLSTQRTGPRDVERSNELEELDRQIADPLRYQGARYQLVEDCLRSAILARGLERSRNEVEARFLQADRFAREINNRYQRMRVAYNRAWTAFWWYEDYQSFHQLYDEVEQLAQGSEQAREAELLLNLWMLLVPSVDAGRFGADNADVQSRMQRLVLLLEPISTNPVRLNNALQARTDLVLVKIAVAGHAERVEELDSYWSELEQIVERSSTLGSYPVERLLDIAEQFGQAMNSQAFDSFYECIVKAVGQRRSDGEAGRAYTRRGVQKLDQDLPYQAIAWFGRAEELLIKREYRSGLILALIGSSFAYERVGLLWAARSKTLAAVEKCLTILQENGQFTPPALRALQRLVWIELQLGRIPQALSAMGFANVAATHLITNDDERKPFEEERRMQEGVLGIHFLNVPFEKVASIGPLPDILNREGLFLARFAALYALGHEQTLRDEGWIPPQETADDVHDFFKAWHDQPATEDIPSEPTLGEGEASILRSVILGTSLELEASSDSLSIGIAESILGVVESLLATSTEHDLLPHREQMRIRVRASADAHGIPTVTFSDDGSSAEILHPERMEFSTADEMAAYSRWLEDTAVEIIPRIVTVRDAKTWLSRIAGQERAFARALVHGNVLTLGRNVFGNTPAVRVRDLADEQDRTTESRREDPWRAIAPANTNAPKVALRFGSGAPPAGEFDPERLKHTDRRVLSPIDSMLWDRAKWRAAIYAYAPDNPPLLGLGFDNRDAAEAIFRRWRERWGTADGDDAIRLTIVTGISRKNPAEYAVSVGPNLELAQRDRQRTIVTLSRIQRMSPSSSTNLDTFRRVFREFEMYFLVPVVDGEPITELAIAKRHLTVREAWTIGRNDPDCAVLDEDDDPIIPTETMDAPVVEALAHLRTRRARAR